MKMHTDENGNPVPALSIGAKGFYIDGSTASATSNPLSSGFYRICAAEATADGVNYTVGEDPADDPLEAEATDTYLAVGVVETIFIPNGQKIAVLGGKMSVTLMV
ncbi:MAG: hypothetical protein ACOXZV_00745 [Bacteroidales bacterium]|jgi:hypothetical protein